MFLLSEIFLHFLNFRVCLTNTILTFRRVGRFKKRDQSISPKHNSLFSLINTVSLPHTSIVFNFSWDLQLHQEEIENKAFANFVKGARGKQRALWVTEKQRIGKLAIQRFE